MILKLFNQYHKLRQRGDHQKQELSEWKQAEHKIRGINHKQLQEKKDKNCEAQNQGGTLIEKKTQSYNRVSAIDRTPNCITMQHSGCKIIAGPLFFRSQSVQILRLRCELDSYIDIRCIDLILSLFSFNKILVLQFRFELWCISFDPW